ncbi:MAG: ATP-binding protein [Planctomycetota bacterium]|jgi:anti-sigma regulatory factor (Ser/Thr protein kinase)
MNTDTKKQENSTNTQIELRICANPEYLSVARTAVRQVVQVLGLEEDKGEPITLAVVEALTNVIRHSYGGPCEKPIIIKLNKIEHGNKNKPALEIVIRDFGKQVDPKGIKGRDLAELSPGGVGVHIIRSVMDEIEFSNADDCGMQLRMVKYINKNI